MVASVWAFFTAEGCPCVEGPRSVYLLFLGGHLTTINQTSVAVCGPVFVWMYILGLLSLVYLSLGGSHSSHSCKLEEKTAASGASHCLQHLPPPPPKARETLHYSGGWRGQQWGLTGSLLPQQDPSVSYPRLHLSLKELQGLFRQQLGVEMATTVTVESVEKAPLLTKEVLQAVRG